MCSVVQRPAALPGYGASVLFGPEAQWLALGRPQAQLIDTRDVPALYLAEQLEEALLLAHDRFRAHLAGAADVLEAQVFTFQAVTGEPVVAAGVAVGPVTGERQRNRGAPDDRVVADPFGDIGNVVLQRQRFYRAASRGQCGSDQRQGVAMHQ